MKFALRTLITLTLAAIGSVSNMAQDLPSLQGKVENSVKLKEPAWTLVRKEAEGKQTVYQWGTTRDGIHLLIYYAGSKDEAAERMRATISHISVGPDQKLADLGDEAYLWRSQADGFGVIRFRQGNVYVDLVAPTVSKAKEFARDIAVLIQGN